MRCNGLSAGNLLTTGDQWCPLVSAGPRPECGPTAFALTRNGLPDWPLSVVNVSSHHDQQSITPTRHQLPSHPIVITHSNSTCSLTRDPTHLLTAFPPPLRATLPFNSNVLDI